MGSLEQQQQQIARVATSIAPLVLDFCRCLTALQQPRFHMAELLAFVTAKTSGPDSPGRILRQLARESLLRYHVVDRSQSLYELEWVSHG